MPIAARHPCAITSCKAVVHTRYCDKHKHIQSDVSRGTRGTRGTTTEQGYGTQWQKVRARYISLHPLCTHCEQQGIARPAKEVHHKLELRRGGTNEDDNLQSLCKSCHSRLTRLNDKRSIGGGVNV